MTKTAAALEHASDFHHGLRIALLVAYAKCALRAGRDDRGIGIPGQFQFARAPSDGVSDAVLQIENCEKSVAGVVARNGKACAPTTPARKASAAAAPPRSLRRTCYAMMRRDAAIVNEMEFRMLSASKGLSPHSRGETMKRFWPDEALINATQHS